MDEFLSELGRRRKKKFGAKNIQSHKAMKIREAGTIKTPFSLLKIGNGRAKKYIHVHELFTWNVAIVSSGRQGPVANELLLESGKIECVRE